jgi:integrase
LLLDFEPLLPIAGLAAEVHENDPDAVVAKLRFQQTKIDGAPDTIFVDQEVVAIIRAQQQWAHDHVRSLLRDEDALPPRYLFLAISRNNRGHHPYPKTTLRGRMEQLGELADIRDSQGRRAPLTNVHRFRHTRATSLINANVPVHVVQRYLGHLSPRMTMHYSKTLRETHEREFLRHKKITADGQELALDPRNLFALIELDKRTDRVLPNGLCMLPPRQACNRGNA